MHDAMNMDRDFWFDRLTAEERRLDLSGGFKFLYGPWKGLETARIAFLSLNPGQAPVEAELRVVSDERGNSYEVERTTTLSPITEQVERTPPPKPRRNMAYNITLWRWLDSQSWSA